MKFVQTFLIQFWWCVGLEDMELGLVGVIAVDH